MISLKKTIHHVPLVTGCFRNVARTIGLHRREKPFLRFFHTSSLIHMIQLTATACQEINRLRQRQNQPDALCRLDLQPSSCGQWSYSLSLDEDIQSEDEAYEFEGIRLVVKRDRLDYIRDLKIDFSEDLMGGSFRFDNSLATESCRCGYAFSIR